MREVLAAVRYVREVHVLAAVRYVREVLAAVRYVLPITLVRLRECDARDGRSGIEPDNRLGHGVA